MIRLSRNLKEGSRFFCGDAEGQAAVRTFFSGNPWGESDCAVAASPDMRAVRRVPRRRCGIRPRRGRSRICPSQKGEVFFAALFLLLAL